VSRSPGRDLLVGFFVLLGLAALAYLSLAVGGLSRQGPGGFVLTADFDELGGLKTRAPVVISGVKVGQVRSIALGDDYRAHVTLDLDPRLRLPKDTSASIVTAGLLGDRYISLQLGGEADPLKPGDAIAFTESAVLIERLLGKLVHSTDVGSDGSKQE
jgi:phospholipid/cholesterol/gamma-HCH transport system substrate-binding protein